MPFLSSQWRNHRKTLANAHRCSAVFAFSRHDKPRIFFALWHARSSGALDFSHLSLRNAVTSCDLSIAARHAPRRSNNREERACRSMMVIVVGCILIQRGNLYISRESRSLDNEYRCFFWKLVYLHWRWRSHPLLCRWLEPEAICISLACGLPFRPYSRPYLRAVCITRCIAAMSPNYGFVNGFAARKSSRAVHGSLPQPDTGNAGTQVTVWSSV